MAELDGQLALVTRAAGPLAEGLAEALARAGARLALADPDAAVAEVLAARLRERGREALAYGCPFTAAGIERALDEVAAAAGLPTVLVTCPAPPVVRPSADLGADEFAGTIELNLVQTFLWCQAAGRRMVAAGHGVIVNVTGLSGMGGWPGWLADSAAFGGVHNLTHTLATEWSRYGVRTNCLVPGVTEDLLPYLLQTPEAPDRETVLKRIPAGRLAQPDDLGKALIYLVRPAASFISGEILRVDGAWDVWGRYYAVDPGARR
jgi:NAD(P)-dependent dehydrogenase (short-subunit alcohol dehydrogenase family)